MENYDKKSRRNLLLAVLSLPIAATTLLFSKKSYSAVDPVQTGLLTKIQAEVALIYAWLEERVKVWNEYIEKVNNGLDFLDNIKRAGEYLANYAEVLKTQLGQLQNYAKSFEQGGRSILSMRFRRFNLEAQAIVIYHRSLWRKAVSLISDYDAIIDNKVKNKDDANKIREASGKRAAAEISGKAYDSIAKARIVAANARASMDDAEQQTKGEKDVTVKAAVFDAATKRSALELQAADVDMEALQAELLAAILQSLTLGSPISTSESREPYTIDSFYDFMQGKGKLERAKNKGK